MNLKPGDKVRLVSPDQDDLNYGYVKGKIYTVYKAVNDETETLAVLFEENSLADDYVYASDCEPLTDLEVAIINVQKG